MKQNINCPCGKNFSIEVEEEIDLDQNQGHIEKIFDGTFMSFICPACGKKHKPEYRLILLWKSRRLKLDVLPELERGEFYRRKEEKKSPQTVSLETVIGYPEMAERLAVIADDLEPVAIETLKYYLLAKAEEKYPGREINAWYHEKDISGIVFHLDGIKEGELAVMKVPLNVYEKTCEDYRKKPKNETFTHLRCRSYMSVQNILRPDALK
jgi:hypothetical protein